MDTLKIMLPDTTQSLSQYLMAPGSGNIPVYTVLGIGELYNIKSPAGWPFDRFTFDSQWVYADITENDLQPTVAAAIKIFVSKDTGGKGIKWCKRFIANGYGTTLPIVTLDTTFRRYSGVDCKTYDTESLGGQCETDLSGPWPINFLGDLGTRPAYLHSYKWAPNYENMELNYFAPEYYDQAQKVIVPAAGRVQWERWQLVNGVYVMQQQVAYNKWVQGPTPGLVFPCKGMVP